MTLLYWNIGDKINQDIVKNNRAQYGKKIVATLSQQLTQEFGKGFSRANIFHMIKFYKVFDDEKIVYSLRTQLSWTHLKTMNK